MAKVKVKQGKPPLFCIAMVGAGSSLILELGPVSTDAWWPWPKAKRPIQLSPGVDAPSAFGHVAFGARRTADAEVWLLRACRVGRRARMARSGPAALLPGFTSTNWSCA